MNQYRHAKPARENCPARNPHLLLLLIGLALLTALMPACGGSGPRASTDPLMDLRNPDLSPKVRADAVTRAWAATAPGSKQRQTTRQALKEMVWATNAPADIRLRAIEVLLDDDDPAALADAREMARLRLATEPSRAVVTAIAKRAADRGWKEYIPALIRSYARPVQGLAEQDRAERAALTTLEPDKSVEQIAFEVFLHPPDNEGPYGQRWDQRTRADAWDVLARIDPEGAWRRQAIASGMGAGAPVLDQLRISLRDLRCLPRTGDELVWLGSLLDDKKPDNRRWWSEASAAVASVDALKAPDLELRHAEVIRYVKATRPEMLALTRDDLMAELKHRLAGRRNARRIADSTDFIRPPREDLDYWGSQLIWPDLLTIIVLDDLIHRPGLVNTLGQQIGIDQRDKTTEYGGVLELVGNDPRLTLYPPRPSTRLGDERFVASDDMIARSDRAMAHYHFHAQADRNERAAGPSEEDRQYARRHGRNCFVITTTHPGVADIDYYQPSGLVLDLGELTLTPAK